MLAYYSQLTSSGILNAAGAVTYQYISDVVEALCFINFYMLIWSYTGQYTMMNKIFMSLLTSSKRCKVQITQSLGLGQPHDV